MPNVFLSRHAECNIGHRRGGVVMMVKLLLHWWVKVLLYPDGILSGTHQCLLLTSKL